MQQNVNTDIWTDDMERILEKLRILCLVRSKYHKDNYFKMLNLLKYFRIPIIILSGVNSVFNIALTNFTSQMTVSLICCFISLVAGLIGSIELFLQIQKNMEIDLLNAKEFYIISIDISKILDLDKSNRHCNPHEYCNEKFANYSKLLENSIIDKKTHDDLISISLIEDLNKEEKFKIINNTSIETIINLREELENRNNDNRKIKNSLSDSILTSLNLKTSKKEDKIFNNSPINRSNNSSLNNTPLSSPKIIPFNTSNNSSNNNIKMNDYSNFFDKLDSDYDKIENIS
jgi:hypothetical protein